MGTLYLVATPIGNLDDITLRAILVLKQVALIAAEDTRSARHLLTHLGITTHVTSYFEHNKLTKLDRVLDALQRGDVALISEAGMPGISDPGYELVRAALARDVKVVPVPGASALAAALVSSGLPTDQFIYLGFLPRQRSARVRLLRSVAAEPRTLVAYEAPHRIRASLDDVAKVLGDRAICVAREMTKVYEEFVRGSVYSAREHFQKTPPRGEFTLVIAGALEEPALETTPLECWSDARVREAVRDYIAAGMPRTDAVKRVALDSGRERREVYRVSISR
jgi:16S rRNA (cytidine1402-2'-O)-methyltransferase